MPIQIHQKPRIRAFCPLVGFLLAACGLLRTLSRTVSDQQFSSIWVGCGSWAKALRSSFRNCEVNLATTIPIFSSPWPDSLGLEPYLSLCVPYNDSQFNPCLLSREQKDLAVPRLSGHDCTWLYKPILRMPKRSGYEWQSRRSGHQRKTFDTWERVMTGSISWMS